MDPNLTVSKNHGMGTGELTILRDWEDNPPSCFTIGETADDADDDGGVVIFVVLRSVMTDCEKLDTTDSGGGLDGADETAEEQDDEGK